MLESIGSSVKLTKSETMHRDRDRDAERKEELADDPFHEGDRDEHGADRERRRHHRQADLVGADLRRLLWPMPRWMWRTMFSRTTMASSISRPMHSDSAIIVMKLSVKPNR